MTVFHIRRSVPYAAGGIRQNVNRQTSLLDRRIFAGIPMIVVIPAQIYQPYQLIAFVFTQRKPYFLSLSVHRKRKFKTVFQVVAAAMSPCYIAHGAVIQQFLVTDKKILITFDPLLLIRIQKRIVRVVTLGDNGIVFSQKELCRSQKRDRKREEKLAI